MSSATFKGSYKPKRSELYVASRNAAAENPRYKPLSSFACQMEAVCANIPSGTSASHASQLLLHHRGPRPMHRPLRHHAARAHQSKVQSHLQRRLAVRHLLVVPRRDGLRRLQGDGASAAIARDYPRADACSAEPMTPVSRVCEWGQPLFVAIERRRCGLVLVSIRSDSKSRIGI